MKKILLATLILPATFLVGCNTPDSANSSPSASSSPAVKVEFATVKTVIQQRCSSCHGGTTPAAGISFENDDNIIAKADRIKVRAVDQKSMPPGNSTNITDEERALLGSWVDSGASKN